jgi:hypothetical protein
MERIMGYFDGLVDGLFKTDEAGTRLFYPNGIIGRGYILPDEPTKAKVRKSLKRWYMIGLPLIIGVQASFGWEPNVFFVAPILISLYYILIRKHLKGLSLTEKKFSYSESIRNSTKLHNLITLIFLFLFSICFIGGGIYVMIYMPHEWFLGLSCILFFGFGGIEFSRMIKIKIEEAKQ